tara:strand:- start:1719 stop:1916 length:198 start_codon:yes stop_codon:yes gene_type:complete
MDYQNKKAFAKKVKRQKARNAKMRRRKDAARRELNQERLNSKIIYKFRERLTPYRKPKVNEEDSD